MAMSQQQYVRAQGAKCPFCGSDEIEGQEVNIEPGGASQEIICRSCGGAWADEYVLTGYSELELPSEGVAQIEPEVETAHFVISGRIPGDDEDTTLVLQLPINSTRDEAQVAFADEMYATRGIDRQSVLDREGQDVYVNSVLRSSSAIAEI